MKKLLLPLFVLIACTLVACNKQMVSETRFVNIEHNDTIPINPNDTASPLCIINSSLLYPEILPATLSIDSVNTLINQLAFGNDYRSLAPEACYKAYADATQKEYLEMADSYYEWPAEERSPAAYTWNFYYTGTFEITPSGFLSYQIDQYTFTGGAHGMSSKLTFVIDVATGSRQTLATLFKPSAMQELSSLISQGVTDLVGIEAVFDESIKSGVVKVDPADNFFITDKEIIFIYNPYEIAPYSTGIIEVPIPFSALKGLLNDQIAL